MPDNTMDSELELIIRKLMTDTQSTTATHEAMGWDETKVAPDMRRIEKEAHTKITNLIAQEANKAVASELKKYQLRISKLEGELIDINNTLLDRIAQLTADKEQADVRE